MKCENRAFRNDLAEIARFLSLSGGIAGNMPEPVEQNEISGILHALYRKRKKYRHLDKSQSATA